jgi:biopolymer transport protein ExbB/TolQ
VTNPQSNVPIPDPSLLTTEALLREVTHIRELYDMRLDQFDLRLEQRFQAQSKALDAALASADLRTDDLTDKTNQMALDAKQTITRAEYSVEYQALIDQINNLRESRDTTAGRGVGANQLWGYIAGAVGLLATVITIVFALTG